MNTKYEALIKEAICAREMSYSLYSKYKVGASLLCDNGKIYRGANIENSSYSEAVCAERVAFLSAINNGERNFKAISVVGGVSEINDFAYPCGSCRQVMSEFCNGDFEIVLYNGKEVKIYTLNELLPNSFSKENIK
ncbi:MAG: cytidine deaminase [Clostridia bacterium]|nr:cytidine deaminase [Clostridia bacterium]